jgi:hypothetical protein
MRIGTGVIVIRTTTTTDASQQGTECTKEVCLHRPRERGKSRTLPYQPDSAVTKFDLI